MVDYHLSSTIYHLPSAIYFVPNFSCQARMPPSTLTVLAKPSWSSTMQAIMLRLPLRQCIITSWSLRSSMSSICMVWILPRGTSLPPRLASAYSWGSRQSIRLIFSPRSILSFSCSTVILFIIGSLRGLGLGSIDYRRLGLEPYRNRLAGADTDLESVCRTCLGLLPVHPGVFEVGEAGSRN